MSEVGDEFEGMNCVVEMSAESGAPNGNLCCC